MDGGKFPFTFLW